LKTAWRVVGLMALMAPAAPMPAASAPMPAGPVPMPAGPAVPRAEARPTGVAPNTPVGAWNVQYDGFAHGLLVLKMQASLRFTASGYDGQLSFHTAGMVGWMVHNVDDSQVHGQFARGDASDTSADRVVPGSFVSIGTLRGTERVTRMTYRDGMPVIGTLTPDVALERSLVPPASTAHTIDTLSALAMLVRQVGDTGRCDGAATIFDGRRLTALTARTIGTQDLPRTSRSMFAGQSLRCDFQGDQLAGFKKDESEADQRRPKFGNAWLATVVPNAPPVPVRVIFDNKVLGQVTLYLTQAASASSAVAQNHR
jgi:hypothetical protein